MEEIKSVANEQPTETIGDGDEIWKSHVAYAQNFMGTDAEYCRRNKLKLRQFKFYKQKFGVIQPRKRRTRAFVKVEREEAPAQREFEKSVRPHGGSLPDPRWMAEFVASLSASLR